MTADAVEALATALHGHFGQALCFQSGIHGWGECTDKGHWRSVAESGVLGRLPGWSLRSPEDAALVEIVDGTGWHPDRCAYCRQPLPDGTLVYSPKEVDDHAALVEIGRAVQRLPDDVAIAIQRNRDGGWRVSAYPGPGRQDSESLPDAIRAALAAEPMDPGSRYEPETYPEWDGALPIGDGDLTKRKAP